MAQSQPSRRRRTPVMPDSMAYDLSRPSQDTMRYSTAAPQLQPKPRPQTHTQPRTHAAPRPVFRVMAVAPTAVVLFLAALLIWTFSLQVRTQITQAQQEVYRLESELRAVEQVQDELEIEYESAFNFTKLEDYAVTTLGMQRPRDEQIYFLSHDSEDHAVAVLERSRSNGLIDRLDDFLSDLLAYFR